MVDPYVPSYRTGHVYISIDGRYMKYQMAKTFESKNTLALHYYTPHIFESYLKYPVDQSVDVCIDLHFAIPSHTSREGIYFPLIQNFLHREDGPAIIFNDGTVNWYLHQRVIHSPEEFQKITKCSDEHLTMLILKYGPII